MDLITARATAVSEMKKHGLIRKGWTFDFDRAVRRLGQCDSTRRRITLSKHFAGAATEDEFEQALLHEIAHALLPASARHGWDWRLKAKEIGYKGKRLASNPYSRQRDAERDAERVGAAAAAAAGAGVQGSLMPTQAAPKVGDTLILPNGMKLKVTEVTALQTKTIEVKSEVLWILDTPDAARFLQR